MTSITKILGFSNKIVRKYGEQVGKTAKNGSSCYLKRKNLQDVFTILDKSGNVIRTKVVYNRQSNYARGYTQDAKGNIISAFEKVFEPLFTTTNNKFTKNIRNIHTEYNTYGQVTHHSDKVFAPALDKLKASVFSNTDGAVSKTYLNTADKTHYTIKCVDTPIK